MSDGIMFKWWEKSVLASKSTSHAWGTTNNQEYFDCCHFESH